MQSLTIVGLRVIAAALAIGACSSPPAAAPRAGSPRDAADSRAEALDDTLHVELGRTATADGGRMALTFDARVSDSRCPANVVCVWMGDAAVRVTARAGATTVAREIHTGIEPRSLSVGGYVVTIVGLTPYPGTVAEGQPSGTPTAILRVTRGG